MTVIEDPTHAAARDRVRAALLDPALSPIVDMVFSVDGPAAAPEFEAASAEGVVRFTRHADGARWAFEVTGVDGRDPLACQDPARLAPLADERATPSPDRSANSYPFAFEQISQLFDSPVAPDLCVQHSAAHNWEDQGGHRGEHGSIGVVQARAPFVMAGAGVAARGLVDRSCRVVDVAPTVLRLAGASPAPSSTGQNGRPLAGGLLARQDGQVLDDLLDPDQAPPEHVVGILWDGTNANVLYDLAARGEAPNVARLMALGTTYAHGAMSCLPTVTLANHTSILTGAQPGHHGILHNAWWDRARRQQVITNSPATWHQAMADLDPSVETLYSAFERNWPGSLNVAVNEPCDAGAGWSTFGVLRSGGQIERPPRADELPYATERFVRPVKEYEWSSRVDHTSVTQARRAFSGELGAVPRFCWLNFTLTDAAFHEGGPYSEIAAASVADSDARLGQVLDAVEAAGVWDRTAFFLVADHGMQESDPTVTGDWGEALSASGEPTRDEGYGFVYVHP
ncbi:MAG: alkaline phosphatase family protein [Acidimicrobiales bacterium]|nr:alkaline phosphatase family protein [Acidimicrobiales bacterium]